MLCTVHGGSCPDIATWQVFLFVHNLLTNSISFVATITCTNSVDMNCYLHVLFELCALLELCTLLEVCIVHIGLVLICSCAHPLVLAALQPINCNLYALHCMFLYQRHCIAVRLLGSCKQQSLIGSFCVINMITQSQKTLQISSPHA